LIDWLIEMAEAEVLFEDESASSTVSEEDDVHLRKPFGSHEDGEEGVGKCGHCQSNQEWCGVDILCIQRAKGVCIVAGKMIDS
jgi:hypothetical protein